MICYCFSMGFRVKNREGTERPGNGQKGTNETPVGNDPTGISAYFLGLSLSGMASL